MDEIRKKQLQILAILKCIDGLCKKEGIRYFIQGGTLLGAVREQGFIEWDDDADVMMYRREYERFADCCQDPLKEQGYFLKFTDRVPKVCRIGAEEIHVDVFIVDGLPRAKALRRLKILMIKFLQGMMKTDIDYSAYSLKGRILLFLTSLPGKLLSCRQKLKLYTALSRLGEEEGSGLTFWSNELYQFIHLEFPEDFLEEVTDLPFEDTKLPAPVNAKAYLRVMFGDDYMTPKRENYYRNTFD